MTDQIFKNLDVLTVQLQKVNVDPVYVDPTLSRGRIIWMQYDILLDLVMLTSVICNDQSQ